MECHLLLSAPLLSNTCSADGGESTLSTVGTIIVCIMSVVVVDGRVSLALCLQSFSHFGLCILLCEPSHHFSHVFHNQFCELLSVCQLTMCQPHNLQKERWGLSCSGLFSHEFVPLKEPCISTLALSPFLIVLFHVHHKHLNTRVPRLLSSSRQHSTQHILLFQSLFQEALPLSHTICHLCIYP